MRFRRLMAAAIAAAAALAIPSVAFGHSGFITTHQDCREGRYTVFLQANVTLDRTVTVTTDVPGGLGLVDYHVDTTHDVQPREIYQINGPIALLVDTTVTLTIDDGEDEEFTTSASIHGDEQCQPSSPPSQAPSPTPTVTPTPRATPSAGTPTPTTPAPTATPSTRPTQTLPPTDTTTRVTTTEANVRAERQAWIAIIVLATIIVSGVLGAMLINRRRI